MKNWNEVTITDISYVCYEANRAFCIGLGEPPDVEATNMGAVFDAISAGVRFRLEHPYAPASAQHNQWCADKRAAGWTLGAVKDAVLKTHPDLRPYAELPEATRRKDALFAAIVRALRPGDGPVKCSTEALEAQLIAAGESAETLMSGSQRTPASLAGAFARVGCVYEDLSALLFANQDGFAELLAKEQG